jgi:hypothetical protein
MVGTTTPAVYGARRWSLMIAIFVLSHIAGALVAGLAVWLIGRGLHALIALDLPVAAAITAAAACLGAVHDLKLTSFPLPTTSWQVPWQWRRFHHTVMAAMFGFTIGTGVLTRIPFATFHVVLIGTALFADLPTALLIMAVYAIARALAVVVVSQLQLLIPDARRRPAAINRLGPLVGYLNGITLGAVTGVSIGTVASGFL